jgi:hypothetical protein
VPNQGSNRQPRRGDPKSADQLGKTIAPFSEPGFGEAMRKSLAPFAEPGFSEAMRKSLAPFAEPGFSEAMRKSLAPFAEPGFSEAMRKSLAPFAEPSFAEAMRKSLAPFAEPSFAEAMRKSLAPFAEPSFAEAVRKSMAPFAEPSFAEAVRKHLSDLELNEEALLTAGTIRRDAFRNLSDAVAAVEPELASGLNELDEAVPGEPDATGPLLAQILWLETPAQRHLVVTLVGVLNTIGIAMWELSGEAAPAVYALHTALIAIALLLHEIGEYKRSQ